MGARLSGPEGPSSFSQLFPGFKARAFFVCRRRGRPKAALSGSSRVSFAPVAARLRPCPFKELSFFAGCDGRGFCRLPWRGARCALEENQAVAGLFTTEGAESAEGWGCCNRNVRMAGDSPTRPCSVLNCDDVTGSYYHTERGVAHTLKADAG